MGKPEGSRSDNHYRSHCSFELKGGRDAVMQLLDIVTVEKSERNLRDIIEKRLEEDDDTEKREFEEKWLISLYTTKFVIKEKVEKVSKKKEKVTKLDKKTKAVLPKSLKVKPERVSSTNITGTGSAGTVEAGITENEIDRKLEKEAAESELAEVLNGDFSKVGFADAEDLVEI